MGVGVGVGRGGNPCQVWLSREDGGHDVEDSEPELRGGVAEEVGEEPEGVERDALVLCASWG